MSQSIIMVKIAFQFSLFNAAEGTSLISILPHPRLFPRSTQTTTFQLLMLAQNIFSGQRVNLHLSITRTVPLLKKYPQALETILSEF